MKRLFIVSIVFLTLFCAWYYDLASLLTLDAIQQKHDVIITSYAENALLVMIVYSVVYIFVAATSIPGATIMTLLGGAIFGVWLGTLIVSFASTIGSTLAFLLARTIFRESFKRRFSKHYLNISKGIDRDGPRYLLTIRLIPVIPFVVINWVMGLTNIKVKHFFIYSQLGMLPATFLYVYAGQEITEITHLNDIFSPSLIIIFILLGTLPWLSKVLARYYSYFQLRRNYKYPRKKDYNLIVIGAGAAGLVSSYIAAKAKAKVLLIEKNKMGGDCLNYGCVPSKAFIYKANQRNMGKKVNFKQAMEHVKASIKAIEPHDSVGRYTDLGVECMEGVAKIKTPFEVSVGHNNYTTNAIIIATGAKPKIPEIKGLNTIKYYTSDTIWTLEKTPKHLVIVGGGAIGCELAQAFNCFDTKVTVIESSATILPREDHDLVSVLSNSMEQEGITIKVNTVVKELSSFNNNIAIETSDNSSDSYRIDDCDVLLFALGRQPNIDKLGLENIGFVSSHVKDNYNHYLATIAPNIFMCGDVTARSQFTHMAAYQAWFASMNGLFAPFKQFKLQDELVPWALFTSPNIARVGYNEVELKELDMPYDVAVYDFNDLDRAIIDEQTTGFVKVLLAKRSDKILGVTIVGCLAGELIAEFVLAMQHKIGLNKILRTTHIYPTYSEANKHVAGVWKNNNLPKYLLKLSGWFHSYRRGQS